MNLRATTLLPTVLQSCRRRVTVGVTFKRPVSTTTASMKREESEPVESPRSKRFKRTMATAEIVRLSSKETQLRNLLLDAARYIDESKEIKDKIELRWAGGWVRDNILGLPSNDIDVAINAMTGVAFCEKLHEYLKDEENMKKHSLGLKDVGSLHKIAANPEKSKHLETVNTRLYDFDLDFVNLRKETYSEDSRNPQMEFGTAEEDALRRDATINALFYNIHTGWVEDFTGGLEDLAAKVIKTPLDPITTFKDDPLRVLRLIRFASRLGFTIEKASADSMRDPAVKAALKLKISRERIGVELTKMLKGINPREALRYIDNLGLYSTIFTDPTADAPLLPCPYFANWHLVYEFFQVFPHYKTEPLSVRGDKPYLKLVRSDEEMYYAWILVALTPLRALSPPIPAFKPSPIGTSVAREGIKADNKICNLVTAAFCNVEHIRALKLLVAKRYFGHVLDYEAEVRIAALGLSEQSLSERSTLGLLIRKWNSDGGNWRLQILFAIFADAMVGQGINGQGIKNFESDLLPHWKALISLLEREQLMDAETIKPCLDGKRLLKDLNAIPGKWVKPALDMGMAYQLKFMYCDPESLIRAAVEEIRGGADKLGIKFKNG